MNELNTLLEKALHNLGFREWAYQIIRPGARAEDKPIIITTFPQFWYDHYIGKGYHTIDPVILDGPKQLLPYQWSGLMLGKTATEDQKGFFAEAREAGVGEGVGIPIHGTGGALAMVSMVSSESSEKLTSLLQSHELEIHLISLVYHNTARELIALGESGRNQTKLSPRERECLEWAAAGKSNWEIAQILTTITEATVKKHVASAMLKLNVRTRQQAVIKAVLSGLINP